MQRVFPIKDITKNVTTKMGLKRPILPTLPIMFLTEFLFDAGDLILCHKFPKALFYLIEPPSLGNLW